MKNFKLLLIKIDGVVFDGYVQSAIFPGTEGEFSVLPLHSPFITTLKKGNITIKNDEGVKKIFAVKEGIVEIRENNQTVVLLENPKLQKTK